MSIDVILWDYDGTIVDSISKNREVTINILNDVLPNFENKSIFNRDEYYKAIHNATDWLDLYINYFGLTYDEAMMAGSKWDEYQIKSNVQIKLISGISVILEKYQDINHSICSLNTKETIIHTLDKYNITSKFNTILGCSDINSESLKPNSDMGIECLKRAKNDSIKRVIYIGDHKVDAIFANNLKSRLDGDIEIISIIVTYSGSNPKSWNISYDHIAESTEELLSIINNYYNG